MFHDLMLILLVFCVFPSHTGHVQSKGEQYHVLRWIDYVSWDEHRTLLMITAAVTVKTTLHDLVRLSTKAGLKRFCENLEGIHVSPVMLAEVESRVLCCVMTAVFPQALHYTSTCWTCARQTGWHHAFPPRTRYKLSVSSHMSFPHSHCKDEILDS